MKHGPGVARRGRADGSRLVQFSGSTSPVSWRICRSCARTRCDDMPGATAAEALVVDALQTAHRNGRLSTVMRSIMLGRPDLDAELRRIEAPTLLVAGADDAMWTEGDAGRFAALAPSAAAAVVPGVRHLAALEAPDRVAALVRDFWAGRAARSRAASATA